jgi:hypothetical protein
MAKIKVSGSASGIGTVTLIAPATATDRTLTLPDATGTLVNTAPSTSGNVLTSDGTNWTSAAAAAGGKVLQVINTTSSLSSDIVTTSTSYVVGTALTGTITPTELSSKIFVVIGGYIKHAHNNIGNDGAPYKIYRDVAGGGYTAVSTGINDGIYSNTDVLSGWTDIKGGCEYLDTPTYTSGQAINYQLWFRKHPNNTASSYFHSTSGLLAGGIGSSLYSITLMEIGA